MSALVRAKEFIEKGMLKEAAAVLDSADIPKKDDVEALILRTKIKLLLGEFNTALEFAEKALETSIQKRDYIVNLKDRILQLGDLWKQGKFKECYEIMMLTKEKLREGVDFDDTQEAIVKSYVTLGVLNYNQGLFEESLGNLTKAMDLIDRYGLTSDTCQIHYYVGLNALELDNPKRAKEEMDILLARDSEHGCEITPHHVKLMEALILMKQDTWKDKAEAENLFEEVLDIQSLPYETKVFALIQYCNLLVDQLKSVSNKEVFEKAKSITQQIYHLANAQGSYTLIVNSLLLQVKFSILDLDLKGAYELLDQAEKIADEKKLSFHLLQIDNLRKLIENELEEIDNTIRRNLSLKERVEMMNYQDYFDLALRTSKKKEEK